MNEWCILEQKDVYMNEWMFIWTNRCLFERMGVYMNEWIFIWIKRCLYERIDVYMNEWMLIWTHIMRTYKHYVMNPSLYWIDTLRKTYQSDSIYLASFKIESSCIRKIMLLKCGFNKNFRICNIVKMLTFVQLDLPFSDRKCICYLRFNLVTTLCFRVCSNLRWYK